MRTYQEVVACFAIENCKLLTTETEFNEIKQREKYKYKYIASCGHEHFVGIYSFISKYKRGILCPTCVIKRNSTKAKETMSTDKLHP